MFVNKGSEYTPFRIFWLVILLELLICGDRIVLGRHLHRHSHSRRLHRQSSAPSKPVLEIPAEVDSNDLDLPKYEDLEKAERVISDDSGDQEFPEIHDDLRAPPRDFVFIDDAYPAPNDHGANGWLTNIEDNEINRNTKPEKNKDYEDPSKTVPVTPESIGSRNIIKAPLKECGAGERRDSKGRCRLTMR